MLQFHDQPLARARTCMCAPGSCLTCFFVTAQCMHMGVSLGASGPVACIIINILMLHIKSFVLLKSLILPFLLKSSYI